VLIAELRVSASGDALDGVIVITGHTRKLPLHEPEQLGYVVLVAVTVIAYNPTGDAAVVLSAPVEELIVIPVGGVPPSVHVNPPVMPEAAGAVA
jgi:hypothetical protein